MVGILRYQHMSHRGLCGNAAFDEAGWGYGYSRPASHPWVRIDHVIASRDWTFTRSRVGPDLDGRSA